MGESHYVKKSYKEYYEYSYLKRKMLVNSAIRNVRIILIYKGKC